MNSNSTANTILIEVRDERDRQDKKWGGPEHDDKHTIAEFVQWIKDYAGWARMMASMLSYDKARKRLIQIAAMAVAAVELIDRKHPLVPCLGRVAYLQGIQLHKNPFDPVTEKELFNKWIGEWINERDNIPF